MILIVNGFFWLLDQRLAWGKRNIQLRWRLICRILGVDTNHKIRLARTDLIAVAQHCDLDWCSVDPGSIPAFEVAHAAGATHTLDGEVLPGHKGIFQFDLSLRGAPDSHALTGLRDDFLPSVGPGNDFQNKSHNTMVEQKSREDFKRVVQIVAVVKA